MVKMILKNAQKRYRISAILLLLYYNRILV